jgi:hypothetical protein
MPLASTRTSFAIRLFGAAALDTAIYEEVEADRTATGQAMVVVVLSSLAAGVGIGGREGVSLQTALVVSGIALIAWAAWAVVTFEIGGRLLPEPQTQVDVGELLRTIGFASAPGILRVFGIIPSVTIPAFAITTVWMLLTMIVAVRQALDYTSTARAVAVCGLGWALAIAIAVTLGLLFGPTVS